MRPIDLRDLIVGLIMVIFLAIATGQYRKLEAFARGEMHRALVRN
jgi:putative sterol carrier protein